MNFLKNIGIVLLSWITLIVIVSMFYPEETQITPAWLDGILFLIALFVPVIIAFISQYNTASKLKNRITERTANITAAEERSAFLRSQFDMKETIKEYDSTNDKLVVFNELKELSNKIANFKIDNNRTIADYNTAISKFPLKLLASTLNLKER